MAENAKLKANADAMNRSLKALQEDVQQLAKDQQGLFNATNSASKGPRDVKTSLDGIHGRLKALDAHVREYAKAARAFAEEGAKELEKKKQQPAKKPGVFAK